MVFMVVFVVLFYNAHSAVIDCDNDSIQGMFKTLVDRTDKLEKTVDGLRKENKFLTQMILTKNGKEYDNTGHQTLQMIYNTSDYSLPTADETTDSFSPSFRRIDRQLNMSGTPVAFHATLLSTISGPGTHHELKFETVHTNIDNAYNKYTGAFTCFEPGLYLFTWTVTATSNQYFDTELIKNASILSKIRVTGYPNYNSATGTAIITLASRDVVFIRYGSSHSSGASIYAPSSFSGYKID